MTWFEKEANLRSGGPSSPFSLFVFPFPRPSTFALSPKNERLQDGRLDEGGRFAYQPTLFFNEISLHAQLIQGSFLWRYDFSVFLLLRSRP